MNKPYISSLTLIQLHFPWDLALLSLGGVPPLVGWSFLQICQMGMLGPASKSQIQSSSTPIQSSHALICSFGSTLFTYAKSSRWVPLGFPLTWLGLPRSTSLNYLWYNLNQVGSFPIFTKPLQLGPNLYTILIPQIQFYALIISSLLSHQRNFEL